MIAHVRRELVVSERRACRVVDQHRSTQRRLAADRSEEDRLTADVIALARDYGRHGYRRIRLNVLDEHARESLAIVPARRFTLSGVMDVLADLFPDHGPPRHIRSDNGPEP